MRLRFDQRELELMRGAEQLRGATLARAPRPDLLRLALSLARAGHKLATAAPGASLSLEEGELGLLLEAVRLASQDVQQAARTQDGQAAERREAVLAAFPELAEKGLWRSFGLSRELDLVAARLETALKP